MKRKISLLLSTIFLIFSTLNINSCSTREETVNCFPDQPINVFLNLNLPTYFNLQTVGGWIYVDEQQDGTRGLIVVRTTLSVESNIKIICPKDGAEWILLTGEPTKVATIAPKTYRYNFDQNTGSLSIFN